MIFKMKEKNAFLLRGMRTGTVFCRCGMVLIGVQFSRSFEVVEVSSVFYLMHQTHYSFSFLSRTEKKLQICLMTSIIEMESTVTPGGQIKYSLGVQ